MGGDLYTGKYSNERFYSGDDKFFGSLLITDIGRTFPDNIYFTHEKNDLRPALFNVLVAYAKYNPRIGYCQVCKTHYKQNIETG